MNKSMNVLIDAAVAVGLATALMLVFAFDRAPRSVTKQPVQLEVKAVEVQKEKELPPKPLRLAVTPPQYDDMGELLNQLGEGYKYTKIHLEDLEDEEKLGAFDVIFLTCGTDPESWVQGESMGDGTRPGVRQYHFNEEKMLKVKRNLRDFVGRGGTLYVSDWRLTLIRLSFPELFDPGDIETGAKQTVNAKVVDGGLRDQIGRELELHFDMAGWYPAALTDPAATVYLSGEYRTSEGPTKSTPLLVKVPFKEGTIIFTSFHNEKQNSDQELKLLRFLVFAAVTAKEVAKSTETMISGGFSPQKQNLLSASPDTPSVSQTYHNKKAGRLRFALTFASQGARLKLAVAGPGGQKREEEHTSSFVLDFPNAPAGDWQYTITAVKMPYANFPFTLTIGE
ncbi:MAG TPA: hypothetical protein VGZ22_28785 [Isosphaeraceae bacterium]|jgi:hypothetical protein|nr:hypothetical protein [Isosphaeraceae bacterium]